jgi:hypothetical protein
MLDANQKQIMGWQAFARPNSLQREDIPLFHEPMKHLIGRPFNKMGSNNKCSVKFTKKGSWLATHRKLTEARVKGGEDNIRSAFLEFINI